MSIHEFKKQPINQKNYLRIYDSWMDVLIEHMGIQPQKVAQEWMVKSFLVVFSMEKKH